MSTIQSLQPLPGGIFPGTRQQIGLFHVQITHFVAGGGFAQVYGVSIIEPREFKGKNAVLKRILSGDEDGMESVQREIQVMVMLSSQADVCRNNWQVHMKLVYCQKT
jgi:hypothetical protein